MSADAWAGTVKIQRPIEPRDGPLLVYDESRCVRMTLPQSPELLALFKPYAFKAYARAILRADGTLDFKHRVEDEPW